MNRRTYVLAAAPIALLIGLAAPAAAADGPQPNTPKVPRAVCDTPAKDAVLTAEEGIALRKCTNANVAVKTWHWMGNYGSPYDVANAANGAGIGAGELITQEHANGLRPTFMFY
ncbi:hypothetical protein [Streptomyces telluris]|uniref:Secreted protein n=1 Tax=Streptomyces telluris TaxID=2720021 RepID=A0A9X2LGU8_9ACTN|nr:hypothetical protein [Streptomyces telluris]MCQ8770995.1 hypothetical protein [Streptomyces telluris]